MSTSGRQRFRHIALVAAASLVCATTALAQGTTDAQKVAGTSAGIGKITRTIIDLQPNSPQDGILSTYTATCTVGPGLTATQIAGMYRDSLNFYLGSGGFKAYFSPSYSTTDVRLTKTTNGNFNNTVMTNTIPGNSTTPRALNVEDAPLVSPAGIAALGLGLTGIAWWARRRRRIA